MGDKESSVKKMSLLWLLLDLLWVPIKAEVEMLLWLRNEWRKYFGFDRRPYKKREKRCPPTSGPQLIRHSRRNTISVTPEILREIPGY